MDTCRIQGCERPVHVSARRLCKAHYDQARSTGEIPQRKRQSPTCVVDDCGKPTVAREMCEAHYARFKRSGDPRRTTAADRFWQNVPSRPDDGMCWEFVGPKNPQGYGRFKAGGTIHQAHRFSYELLVGPIPEGLHLDHLCMNKSCVNPEHLEAVTQRENNLRSLNMAGQYIRRNECHICGGELTFYPNRGKYGARVCKACQRRRSAKSRARANAAP